MTPTITDRIATTQEQVANVLAFVENELSGRIVYLQRAGILLDIIGSTLGAMAQVEAAAVPSDFDGAWREYASRLATAKQQIESILTGADCATQPCRVHAR